MPGGEGLDIPDLSDDLLFRKLFFSKTLARRQIPFQTQPHLISSISPTAAVGAMLDAELKLLGINSHDDDSSNFLDQFAMSLSDVR